MTQRNTNRNVLQVAASYDVKIEQANREVYHHYPAFLHVSATRYAARSW